MELSPRRDRASYIQLLEKMVTAFPLDQWLISTDNLSTHHSHETHLALAAWPEIRTQFIPRYPCWLSRRGSNCGAWRSRAAALRIRITCVRL